MEQYWNRIKDIVDQLHLATASIDYEDIVLIALNGLPSEYDSFKIAIRARSESISMEELSSLLCSEAIHVESKVTSSDLTVAYATFKGPSPSSSSPSTRKRFASTQKGRGSSYRSKLRFYKPGRGSFRGQSPNRS